MARMPTHTIGYLSAPLSVVVFALAACGHTSYGNMEMIAPNTGAAHFNSKLALNYLHKGYTDLAQEKIDLALEQAPHDPLVLDSAGYFYEKTGNMDNANKYFTGALLYNPDSNLARNNYGAFLCRNGYDQRSLLYFREASASPAPAIAADARANNHYCTQKMQDVLGDNGIYAYYINQDSHK